MNQKLPVAATAAILLLLPEATAVLLTNACLPTCLPRTCMPACLLACLPAGLTWLNEVLTTQLWYATEGPGKVQGRDRVGIVAASCGNLACEASIRENSFYRETWGTRRGGRYVAKRSSDPPPPSSGKPLENQTKFRDGTV